MRYSASEKLEIIRLVERSHLPVKRTLDKLGIARTTFHRWYDEYQSGDLYLERLIGDGPVRPRGYHDGVRDRGVLRGEPRRVGAGEHGSAQGADQPADLGDVHRDPLRTPSLSRPLAHLWSEIDVAASIQNPVNWIFRPRHTSVWN